MKPYNLFRLCLLTLMVVTIPPSLAKEEDGQILSLKELNDPAFKKLADAYKPAMVFAGPDMWPVDPSYQWSQGSPLMRTIERKKATFEDIEEVLPAKDLSKKNWSKLPAANAKGEPYIYYVDGPGDNSGPGEEQATWITEWRKIQGSGPPEKAPYPPNVLVSALWMGPPTDKLPTLVIKYWFFYPYNKWMNNHESDWEHIQVALKAVKPGKTRLQSSFVFDHIQYEFHGDALTLSPQETFTLKSKNGFGLHPIVFTGGKANGAVIKWKGLYSGGSYPWPALFNFGIVGDDLRSPKRFLHPDQIHLEMITDPADMDFDKRPWLSWLASDVRLGQPTIKANDPLVIQQGGNEFIAHAARKGHWKKHGTSEVWHLRSRTQLGTLQWPSGWVLSNIPTADLVKFGPK